MIKERFALLQAGEGISIYRPHRHLRLSFTSSKHAFLIELFDNETAAIAWDRMPQEEIDVVMDTQLQMMYFSVAFEGKPFPAGKDAERKILLPGEVALWNASQTGESSVLVAYDPNGTGSDGVPLVGGEHCYVFGRVLGDVSLLNRANPVGRNRICRVDEER